MKYFLLDDITGIVSYLPYIIPLASGAIIYFFKQSQLREKIRLDKVDADNAKAHGDFIQDLKDLQKAIEDLTNKINDVNIQILKEINSLAVKLAEYKRDIRN